jgi:pyruvate formate lyase activating enzyme
LIGLDKIRIGGQIEVSTVDWSGHVTFLLFCAGCDFRCPFCSNSSLIPFSSGQDFSLKTIKERVSMGINKGLIDAIGFSGGEPSLQTKPIIQLCRWAKKHRLKTFLNTNGNHPNFIEKLGKNKLLDYVALDVKAPLEPEAYGRTIGLTRNIQKIVERVKESIKTCKKNGISIEVRTTVVPGLIDDRESIRKIAKFIKKECSTYVLQQFYPFKEVLNKKFLKKNSPDRKDLVDLAMIALEEDIEKVYVRTRQNGMERVV